MTQPNTVNRTRERKTKNPESRTRSAGPFSTSLSVEERRMLVSERPITFEQWVDRGGRDLYELVNGSLVEMMAAHLEHERLFAWLFQLLGVYVRAKNLGEVLGSRTAVKITEFGGRLPDMLFVRKERTDIIQKRGIYGEPDLIVEIRSPEDRASDVSALESEYRTIGVPEIWLIDPQKRRVRVLSREESGYAEETVTTGRLESRCVQGFALEADWLWNDERPDVFSVVQELLGQ